VILTIGMASYKNYADVWFTVQALRLYHNLEDCEILVVDNYGDDYLRQWCVNTAYSNVRYIQAKEIQGTSYPRNKIFEEATGEFVLCLDSHIFLHTGVIDKLKMWIRCNRGCADLIQGPMVFDHLDTYCDYWDPIWIGHMWGKWCPLKQTKDLPKEQYEIPMLGLGLFGCYKDKWLGFNPRFRGFGGEEGYIHEKYRRAGHKVICLPWLTWVHKFHNQSSPTSYPNILEDRVRNYIIGFTELGMDLEPIKTHFGEDLFNRAKLRFENETGNLEAPL